jgi:hypothetical protein
VQDQDKVETGELVDVLGVSGTVPRVETAAQVPTVAM